MTDGPRAAEPALPASDRVRLRRKPDRGRYDRPTIDAILDAALVGHVGWMLHGQPYVTPTAIWRQGDRLYWHGSAGSRMVREDEGRRRGLHHGDDPRRHHPRTLRARPFDELPLSHGSRTRIRGRR